jgi:aminopeptidase C
MGILTQHLTTDSTQEQQEVAEEKKEDETLDHVEALAREIYGLLRQRLETEKERHGFSYYNRGI